jgi:hypothetical protein
MHKKKSGRHPQWNTIQPYKEWNPIICNNIDGIEENHILWNKSGTQRQVPYDCIYMWSPKKLIP